ncbi:NAD-dependent epimerase/dehydratase family protein [Williamsia sterculiae]|uniref:Nucleoside-diphosphate-sugar epimerase n=1 Tax=Williamsia sterculiae TaxID=1344003 RepID=A0A1N7DVT5_9NOCA|nr:NAD-dependent epimerase/dehydratase family protein [Williamsia sterculiae]SIR79944.1 Nucleoside-diphosphate-sugar epimerase [Williamsia sterculiae]
MTILVTGGTGLVGSRLLKRLAAQGLECRALVRQGREVPTGVERVEGDILEPATLGAALEGVTTVLHLAALFRTADVEQIWRVNRDGTRNVIAAVHEHAPRARLVMASTSNVYGPGLGHPGRESDETTATHAYPASKIEAEKDVRASGLNWVILRLPFVYGDGDGHLEAAPEQVASMGWHPARKLSVIHHRDVATAIGMALDGVMDGRIVNVADDSPLTVYEIADVVHATYESSNEPLTDPWLGHADVSLARRLGFRPTVSSVYQAQREALL